MARPKTGGVQTLLRRARSFPQDVMHRYRRLSKRSKTTIWAVTIIQIIVVLAIIIITPHRIGRWFNELSIKLRAMGFGGMLFCALLVALASHPPLFGFMPSMTLIGFTYGIWPGFLVASISSLLGAGIAFVSVRTFFLSWIRKRSNDKWDAFGHVMADKGLPLVIMIRYCPLPWALGNGLFASVDGVKFWHFMLANLLLQPRLLIPVFIGSRLVSLTEETPAHDPLRFWLNLGSILLSATFSVTTGYWIYRLTLEQMRKMDRTGDGELAAEALEEGALLGDYSDEEEMEDEPLTVRGESLRPTGLLHRTSSGESR